MVDSDFVVSTNVDTPVALEHWDYGCGPVCRENRLNDVLLLESVEFFSAFSCNGYGTDVLFEIVI